MQTKPTRPAAPFFTLLGKAHTMGILHQLVRADARPWRFTELQRALELSPNTLSTRLEELAEAGLVTRTQYDESPPRVEYAATAKAADLAPVFRELREWARTHERPADQSARFGGRK
ncbi:winged helix-turn-helix transcriptional regulator [Halomicroarcula sp. GCM10025817]|uniref:winged helix-turn-helix transcriptional regulator n=1 Tax=Haloarcula TaxID=2237 RepID=UPI0023E86A2D|nr:helix-turn-helix domain-containing protein [Halomicroarcula sp. SYNS111]